MNAPILVPCLVALRAEFNVLAPGRDKGADGWIGDAAHQQESSDHNPDESGRTPFEDADNVNEVHALDIDKDLGTGLSLGFYVERIRRAHQAGADNRLQNIIWQGRIASASWGWSWRTYTGPSKHFDHAHFSARYVSSAEYDISPWGVAPPPPEVPAVSDPSWSSQTVLDLNFLIREAWRATQPGFPAGELPSGADKNARNVRTYLAGIIDYALDHSTVAATLDGIETNVDALLEAQKPPVLPLSTGTTSTTRLQD